MLIMAYTIVINSYAYVLRVLGKGTFIGEDKCASVAQWLTRLPRMELYVKQDIRGSNPRGGTFCLLLDPYATDAVIEHLRSR